MPKRDAMLGEVHRRLIDLGLPEGVRQSVMALVRTGAGRDGRAGDARAGNGWAGDGRATDGRVRDGRDASDGDFGVRVAQTFYKTALRATDALGTTSISTLIMLFDLYVAFEQGRAVSVSSLCIASGAAPTTALRQIGQLELNGFVVRQGDAKDRRRSWVTPTPAAQALIRMLVEDWSAMLHP